MAWDLWLGCSVLRSPSSQTSRRALEHDDDNHARTGHALAYCGVI
jgi:hypothetical protein